MDWKPIETVPQIEGATFVVFMPDCGWLFEIAHWGDGRIIHSSSPYTTPTHWARVPPITKAMSGANVSWFEKQKMKSVEECIEERKQKFAAAVESYSKK